MKGIPAPGKHAIVTAFKGDECEAVLLRPLQPGSDAWWVNILNAYESVRDPFTKKMIQ